MTDTAFAVTPKGAKAIADWEARFAAQLAREKLAFEKNRAALFAVPRARQDRQHRCRVRWLRRCRRDRKRDALCRQARR